MDSPVLGVERGLSRKAFPMEADREGSLKRKFIFQVSSRKCDVSGRKGK